MKNIIEWIGDVLLESRVMEQAVSRRRFKDVARRQIDNIIENWCMILWARRTGDEKYIRCINHWKQEIRSAMVNATRSELKSGDMRNAIIDVFDEKLGDWHRDRREAMRYVTRAMMKKLDDEGCYFDSNDRGVIEDISGIFIDNINNIIDVMCDDDYLKLRDYSYSL